MKKIGVYEHNSLMSIDHYLVNFLKLYVVKIKIRYNIQHPMHFIVLLKSF